MSAVNSDRQDDPDEPILPAGPESIEMYEADDGIVFYDAQNPLAWVQSSMRVYLHDLR